MQNSASRIYSTTGDGCLILTQTHCSFKELIVSLIMRSWLHSHHESKLVFFLHIISDLIRTVDMQNIETKGHSLVIAIDFGTTYSAYAYAHVEEKLDIRVMNFGKK